MAHRGLTEMQPLTGAREAPLSRDLGERSQVRELHVHRRSISNRQDSDNSFHDSNSFGESDDVKTIEIRPAAVTDVAAITTIYNQGIEDRLATLETELRTPAERAEWLAARGPRHPVLVAETDGVVTGWASLNRFNPRPAYDHVADFSIYIERGWRGRGVGRRLLTALVELAQALGYHKMVLAAFPFNPAGVTLYERLGFTTVGVYREQGVLDGKWVDVLVMERVFTEARCAASS
jgi:L-amino acid N-acyltransferase YncA